MTITFLSSSASTVLSSYSTPDSLEVGWPPTIPHGGSVSWPQFVLQVQHQYLPGVAVCSIGHRAPLVRLRSSSAYAISGVRRRRQRASPLRAFHHRTSSMGLEFDQIMFSSSSASSVAHGKLGGGRRCSHGNYRRASCRGEPLAIQYGVFLAQVAHCRSSKFHCTRDGVKGQAECSVGIDARPRPPCARQWPRRRA